ncbi:MAG: hypothetical protein CME69_07010 [Halobacteriovorax sp.]|nr:hypothetical protein [Halobacteriovorax sp.]|tara:strand:+ start:305 stop:838 length:534 start_codon:yes stop_codon:yes gene_type:complete
MKILISAFTPFNGRKSNTSLEVLKLLSSHYETVLLETSYERSTAQLKDIINETNPDFVIMLGESGKCDDLVIEKLAINFAHSTIPDNDGKLLKHKKIFKDGPDLIETKLDLTIFNDQFKVSYHAGTYVCNYLYFQILHEYQTRPLKSLFIHLSTKNDPRTYEGKIVNIVGLIKQQYI